MCRTGARSAFWGQGWVNLNGAGVRKYSDADFPHWRRWSLIDDSADQDSRCDSKTLKSWLDISGDGQVDPIEAAARLSDASVAPKLAHAICKFPTEWDASTIEQRWGWLKTQTDENPSPFTETDFALLKAHIQKLAFFPGGMLARVIGIGSRGNSLDCLGYVLGYASGKCCAAFHSRSNEQDKQELSNNYGVCVNNGG
jgi:hypothetical protein